VSEPRNCAFNFPAMPVTTKLASVLDWWLPSILAVRTDQFNPGIAQPLTERVPVCCLVVEQPWRLLVEDSMVQQWLDQTLVAGGCTRDMHPQRETLAIDQHEQLCPFSLLRLTDTKAPFFAGAKVASAMANSQSISPSRSSFFSRRDQTFWKIPASTHSLRRRQQVGYDGNLSGKSCHRQPARRIQRIPSRHGRDAILGRPPVGPSGNRSLIKLHCSSVSSGFGTVLAPVVLRPRWGHHSRVNNMRVSPFNRRRHAIGLPIKTAKCPF
jgi:hypothetical protein